MALYIPHSIFHLAGPLYVNPETFGPYYVCDLAVRFITVLWSVYFFKQTFCVNEFR